MIVPYIAISHISSESSRNFSSNTLLILIRIHLQKLPGVFLQHRPALVLEGVAPPVDRVLLVIEVSTFQKTTYHHILSQGEIDELGGRANELLKSLGLLKIHREGVKEESLRLLIDCLDHGIRQQIQHNCCRDKLPHFHQYVELSPIITA